MERPKTKGDCDIIGGKTILGKIFQYQEKTGMSYDEVLKLPYITFVLGMADAPQIDYDSKKEKKTKRESKKQKLGFGTPLNQLPPDVIAQMR